MWCEEPFPDHFPASPHQTTAAYQEPAAEAGRLGTMTASPGLSFRNKQLFAEGGAGGLVSGSLHPQKRVLGELGPPRENEHLSESGLFV